jgi:hypothetical protein
LENGAKNTIRLLLLLALHNNPLFGTKIVSWSTISYMDSILKGILVGYLIYYNFILFDYLRYQNRALSDLFFISKILFSFVIGFIYVTNSVIDMIMKRENRKNSIF